MTAPTDGGARLACEQATRELEGAVSILLMLAETMKATPDGDATNEKAAWGSSISFVARALIDTEQFVREWVQFDEKQARHG